MSYGRDEQLRLNQMTLDRRAAQQTQADRNRASLMELLDQQPKYQFSYRSPEFTRLRSQVSGGGPLEQYEKARSLLALQARQNMDRQTADLAGQQASAYSQLAMGGGLSSGARERVAAGGLQQNLMARQGLRGETQTQYADIGAREAADKLETQKQIAEILAAEQQRKQNMAMDAWKLRAETMASLDKADAQRRATANSCFGEGTLVEMADGTHKPIEQITVRDEVKDGGKVYATQLASFEGDAYKIGSTVVTGSHAIFEDGAWIRVRDSKRAKPHLDRVNVVYNLATENHVLWIGDVLYADLHETDQYEHISDEDSLTRMNMVEVPGFGQPRQAVC